MHSLKVTTEYQQFYLMDAEGEPAIPEEVTDTDLVARVRVAPNIAVLHTSINGALPVKVEIAAARPGDDSREWEHVVEFPLHVPSGKVVVAGLIEYLPECPRIDVPAGQLRGRASFRQVPSTEECRVTLWPEPTRPAETIKRGKHAS